jgi:pectinesterase inhibitor-like protein
MACTSKILVLLVPMFLGLIAEPNLVNGDATLINDVCNKTISLDYCYKCFDMYGPSAQEGLIALGRTSINYGSYQCDHVLSSLIDFVGNTTNQELKSAFMDCASKYHSANEAVTNALFDWQDASYTNASNQITVALQYSRDCGAELQGYNPSPALADGINTFEGFCEASDGVLKQIAGSSL